MNILLLVVIGISNIILCLVFWMVLGKILEYKNGMVLGMHVDRDKLEDPDLVALLKRYEKRLNFFKLVLVAGSIFTLAMIWSDVSLFIVLYMTWLVFIIAYYQYISVFCMRDMYRLKEDRGWLTKGSSLVKVDTRVSSMVDKIKISPLVHLPFMAVYTYLLIDSLIGGKIFKAVTKDMVPADYQDFRFIGLIVLAIGLVMSLSFLYTHIIYGDRKNQVYCEDSKINYMANRVDKLYWSRACLIGDIMVFLTNAYILYRLTENDWLYDIDFGIYIGGLIISSIVVAFVAKIVNTKKDDILSQAKNIEYMDDDYYWRKGWYSNPNDKRIFVPSRLNTMNQEFNMAKKSAIVINIVLLLIILGTLIVCLVPIDKNVIVKAGNDQISVKSGMYKTEFKRSDILDLDLVDDLEDDSYIRTNGISMGEIGIGRFRGKKSGRLDLYINSAKRPLVRVKLKNKLVYISGDKNKKAEKIYKLIRGK